MNLKTPATFLILSPKAPSDANPPIAKGFTWHYFAQQEWKYSFHSLINQEDDEYVVYTKRNGNWIRFSNGKRKRIRLA
jgi:hypothetical protein